MILNQYIALIRIKCLLSIALLIVPTECLRAQPQDSKVIIKAFYDTLKSGDFAAKERALADLSNLHYSRGTQDHKEVVEAFEGCLKDSSVGLVLSCLGSLTNILRVTHEDNVITHAVNSILSLSSHPDRAVRIRALTTSAQPFGSFSAHSRIPEEMKPLVATIAKRILESTDSTLRTERLMLVQGLGSLGVSSQEVWNYLLKAIEDPESEVRRAALGAVSKLQNYPENLDAILSNHVLDPSYDCSSSAIYLCAKLELKSCLENVFTSKAKIPQSIIINAYEALAMRHDPRVIGPLTEILSSSEAEMRERAARLLATFGKEATSAQPALLSSFKPPFEDVRPVAEAALFSISPDYKSAYPPQAIKGWSRLSGAEVLSASECLRAYKSSDASGRMMALQCLLQIPNRGREKFERLSKADKDIITSTIYTATSDPYWIVREKAISGLDDLLLFGVDIPENVMTTILKDLNDNDPHKTQKFASLLGKDADRYKAILIKGLESNDPELLTYFIQSCRNLSVLDEPLIKRLMEVAHSPETGSSRMAVNVIRWRGTSAAATILSDALSIMRTHTSVETRILAANVVLNAVPGQKEAVDFLIEKLSQSDHAVRREALLDIRASGNTSPSLNEAVKKATLPPYEDLATSASW